MKNAKLSDIDSIAIFVTIKGKHYPIVPKPNVEKDVAELMRYTMVKALLDTHGITDLPDDKSIIHKKKK